MYLSLTENQNDLNDLTDLTNQNAGSLAGCGADPARELGEVVGLQQLVQSLAPVVSENLKNEIIKLLILIFLYCLIKETKIILVML